MLLVIHRHALARHAYLCHPVLRIHGTENYDSFESPKRSNHVLLAKMVHYLFLDQDRKAYLPRVMVLRREGEVFELHNKIHGKSALLTPGLLD